jgi:CubicO group peptidase (beta-lactamase class C family)
LRKILRVSAWTLAAVLTTTVLFLAFGQPSRVAMGYASHLLCSETFVSGLDPAKIFAERVAGTPGVGLLGYGLQYDLDRERRQVTASYFGFLQRRSVWRDRRGCLLVQGGAGDAGRSQPQRAPDAFPGEEPVKSSDSRIRAALDRVFTEWTPPLRRTKAVVVMHDGRIVAERYAEGYGVRTRLLSWSAAKSATSALVGVLVRQGRLSVDQPAPVAQWRRPGDPRAAITIGNLLRMNDGLDFSEGKGGWDKVSRMLFIERDMAGYVEGAPLEYKPGAHWRYCSGATMVLSRIIRDAVGGSAEDVRRFAERELFGPLGMSSAMFEFDATGTPIGSSFMFASARDWAKFGMLYVNDGVAGGRRILPEGWVRYSARPTPGSAWGYGAGWWTNAGDSPGAVWRRSLGMPAGSFFAQGFQGQFVVVAPAERLVAVRFGITQRNRWGDVEGVARLTADVLAALGGRRRQEAK